MAIAWLLAATIARATDAPDYAPPADGKLTDKQVAAYVAILKEQADAKRAMARAVDSATTEAAKVAAVEEMGRKQDAAVGHHGLSAGEFAWVGGQLDAALPTAMVLQQWDESTKPDLERQVKALQAAVTAVEDALDGAKAGTPTAAKGEATVEAVKQQLAAVQAMLSAGPPVPDADPKPDADNVALARKHVKDYLAAIGGSEPASPK